MPLNLFVKTAFVRGSEQYGNRQYDGVRTDFILQNVYSYLLSGRHRFNRIPHMNKIEEEVLKQFKEIVDAFRIDYVVTVKSLCTELNVSIETVGSILHGIADELFSDGITWSRIIALSVFVGELTLSCLSRGFAEFIADLVYECFSALVKEKLEPWVLDHGGWSSIGQLNLNESSWNLDCTVD